MMYPKDISLSVQKSHLNLIIKNTGQTHIERHYTKYIGLKNDYKRQLLGQLDIFYFGYMVYYIDFCILYQPCIPGINPIWFWCVVLFMCILLMT